MILQFEESRSAVTQILQIEEKSPQKMSPGAKRPDKMSPCGTVRNIYPIFHTRQNHQRTALIQGVDS